MVLDYMDKSGFRQNKIKTDEIIKKEKMLWEREKRRKVVYIFCI